MVLSVQNAVGVEVLRVEEHEKEEEEEGGQGDEGEEGDEAGPGRVRAESQEELRSNRGFCHPKGRD